MAVSYPVLISICKLFEQVPFGFCFHRCSVVRWNVYFLLPYSRLQGTLWISCMCYCGTWTPPPCPHHYCCSKMLNSSKFRASSQLFQLFFPSREFEFFWPEIFALILALGHILGSTKFESICRFFPCLHVSSMLCQRLSSWFVCFGVLESGCAVFCLRYLLVWRKKGPPMSCKFFFFQGPNVFVYALLMQAIVVLLLGGSFHLRYIWLTCAWKWGVHSMTFFSTFGCKDKKLPYRSSVALYLTWAVDCWTSCLLHLYKFLDFSWSRKLVGFYGIVV